MTDDCFASDPDRLTGYEPGTVFVEDGGRKLLVIWDGLVVTDGNARPCIDADPDTQLVIHAVPVKVNGEVALDLDLRARGREANLALVESLPVGSIFLEDDDRGRRHWFIKTFHGVTLDNGGHHVSRYDGGGDDDTAVSIASVPRGEHPEARAAFERLLR
jgi:hypothetical protein